MVRTTSLAYWKIMKHRFEMTNIEPSYDHHMTIILPTGIAGGAGTKAGVGLFLWNGQISKRLLLYLYISKTCWRWWEERKFQKRARHSQQQQDIAQGWGFRSWSKRFLNFKFTNHLIERTLPDNLHPYMQKTCDVAEKAILAKKKLRKKCVNRDKM